MSCSDGCSFSSPCRGHSVHSSAHLHWCECVCREGVASILKQNKWKLRFIRSEFKGQLPKPYTHFPNATIIIPEDMNDMNKEEPSRYVHESNLFLYHISDFCWQTPMSLVWTVQVSLLGWRGSPCELTAGALLHSGHWQLGADGRVPFLGSC